MPRPNGGIVVYKATGAQTGGAYGLAEYTVPPASDPAEPRVGVLARMAVGEDESWYILEGELIFTVGERTVRAPTGTLLFVQRGVAHATVNPGTRPARYLVWFTPAGMEGYFAERAQVVEQMGGEADVATLAALGAKYGMERVDERRPSWRRSTDVACEAATPRQGGLMRGFVGFD